VAHRAGLRRAQAGQLPGVDRINAERAATDANDPELTSSSPNPKHYFVPPERTVVPSKGELLRQPADLMTNPVPV